MLFPSPLAAPRELPGVIPCWAWATQTADRIKPAVKTNFTMGALFANIEE
jgi:hypothetical protein